MEQSETKLKVIAKIKEYEKAGRFNEDVEEDPPATTIRPQDVDYINKKLSSKIMTAFANFLGRTFFESMIKKNQEEYYTAIQHCNNAGNSTEFIEFMLKMIDNTIDEMNNSKEMKDKSQLLLSENELKVLECIKRNVIIGAKDIIEQTDLSDSTVRRILRKFLQDKKIETTDNNEKSPNKKYKLTE